MRTVVELDAVATGVSVTEDVLRVTLADGRELTAPLAWFPRLRDATREQQVNWRLVGRGQGVHWPEIDEDISVAGLLRVN